MIYMLERLMASSTKNEVVIKGNLAVLIVLLLAQKVLGMLHFKPIDYLITSIGFYLLESIAVIMCCRNIYNHSGYEFSPLQSLIGGPLSKDAFKIGPLSHLICNLPKTAYHYLLQKKATQPTTPASAPKPATPAPATTQTTAPTLTFRSTPWVGPVADSPLDAVRKSFGPNTGAVQDMRDLVDVPVPERMGDPSLIITLPKLESRPCHMTRRKKAARMNKYLWRLNPQPNTIERFREEQIEDFTENRDRFDDRGSKVYYDKLRQWLAKNVIDPILNTVKLVEKQLSQQGTNFVDCPPNILALLMVEPTTMEDNTFPISLVQRMISVKGYENDRARKHVLERLKELVKRSRYHIITEPGLPTDSEIILHVFNTYLGYSAPNVVPVLAPLQNSDVYKFLLLYFYTTEDLKHEIFE